MNLEPSTEICIRLHSFGNLAVNFIIFETENIFKYLASVSIMREQGAGKVWTSSQAGKCSSIIRGRRVTWRKFNENHRLLKDAAHYCGRRHCVGPWRGTVQGYGEALCRVMTGYCVGPWRGTMQGHDGAMCRAMTGYCAGPWRGTVQGHGEALCSWWPA